MNSISTKAIYTIHENNRDFYFFSYYAGGFSTPFAVTENLIKAHNALREAFGPENPLAAAALLPQMRGNAQSFPEDSVERPLFRQISDSEMSAYFDNEVHGIEIPYHIKINMDEQTVTFEFNPDCREQIGLPDMELPFSTESWGRYFAHHYAGQGSPSWQDKEGAFKEVLVKHNQQTQEKAATINKLIEACDGRVRLGPTEYPASDYPWSIKEVADADELVEAFKHGNWSVRTGFVLGNLAFVEQVSGGDEWLALKNDEGDWKTFDSISFYGLIKKDGDAFCRMYIDHLQDTQWQELKPPEQEPQMTM